MTVDLDKLEQLARAATPGPWTYEEGFYEPPKPDDDFPDRVGYDDMANVYGAPVEVGTPSQPIQEVPRLAYLPSNADAAFIAAARTAIPELIARVRAAEGLPAREGNFLEAVRGARAELEAKGVNMNAAEFLRERDEDSRAGVLKALLQEADQRLRAYGPYADDGPGTLRARIGEVLADREVTPAYGVLRDIVRDLAASMPNGFDADGKYMCVLCGSPMKPKIPDDDGEHHPTCVKHRAVEAVKP